MPNENRVPLREERLPSNSHKSKNNTPPNEEVKLKKVVSGKVTTQKKSLGKKFSEAFLGDDNRSVGDYVVHEVLIPALKDLIYDSILGGLDASLFGGRRRRGADRRPPGSHTSYASFFKGGRDRDDRDRRDISKQSRARHDFDEVVIADRGEAEEVLSQLVDLTIDYGQATVEDFYELVGMESNYTDRKYGWTDLRTSSVSRVRGGYLINLPRTIVLD